MSTDKHSSLKSRKSIKRHRCEFCNKEFMSSSALVIHRRSHTGMRPYKCPFCSRAFSQMTGIQHHIRTHTGERPYVCNICHFKFSRSDSLARHIKKRHSSVQNGLGKRKKKTSEISKKQLLLSYHNNSHSDPSTSQLTDTSSMLNGFLDIPTELQSSPFRINSDVHITDDTSKNSRLKFPDETQSRNNKVIDSFIRDKRYMNSRIQSPRLRTKSMEKKYPFSNCNLPEFRYSEVAHQKISVPQNEISENSRKNYKSTEQTSLPQSKVNKRCNYNPNISYANNLDNMHFKNINDINVSSELESRLHNKLDNYQYSNRKIPDTKNGGKYKCFFCFKCFASKSALNIHKRIHTGIRPYVCKMCGRSFTQKTGLRHHYRTHTQERPYKCSICFYAFARSDSLLRHTKLRHKKLKKKAPVYNKQLRKPPECYPNSEQFLRKSNSFKQVILQNENNNLFENDCLVAKNVNNLDIQEYSIRNNTSSDRGSVVDTTLLLDPLIAVSDEINYGRHHVQSTDLGNSNLTAGVILNIERPEITRTNSPIYITDDEEEFDAISFPEKNENVHAVKSYSKPSTNSKSTTGKYGKKRNLPCNFCHKTFSSFSVLKVHRRIHTGVRPYRCKFCGRSFTQQTGLTHHLRTHTGEKPYSCGNCNAQFSRSDSLARHRRQQHLKQSNTVGNYLKQINRTKKDLVSSSSADENLNISAKDVRLSESETNNIQAISDNNSSIDQVNFTPVVIKSEVSNDELVSAVIRDTSSKDDAGSADKLKADDLSPTWKRDSSYRDDGNFSNIEIETFQPVPNAFSPSNEPNLQQKCSSCKKVFNDKTLLSSHVCEVNTEYQCFLCDMNFNNTILLAEHMSEQHNLKQNCKREGELSQFSFEDEFGSLVEMVITHNNDRDVCRIYLSDFSENTQTIEMNMDEKINQNLSDIWDSTENIKLEIPENSPNDCDSKANIFCQSDYSAGTISNHKDSSEGILQIKLEQNEQEISDIGQNNNSFESFCLTNQEQEFHNAIEPNTNPLGTQSSGISSEASNFVDNSSHAGISIPLVDLNQCKTEDTDSNTAQLNTDSKQTRNKQRQCEFCKKSFNSKWALIIHRRSHTGEKPYECGHCGRGFSQLSGVQHHILTHTGERPFECQICRFRFARSDSLVRHIRLKHSEYATENGSKEEPKKVSTLFNNQSLVRDLRSAYSTDVLDMDPDIQNNCTRIEPLLQDKNLINLSEYPLLLSSQVKEPDTGENFASNSEGHITLKDIHKEVDFDKDINNSNMLSPLSSSKDICAKLIKTLDCKFCGSLFTNSDVLLQHLMQRHSDEIILNDIKETDILPKSGSEQNKNSFQDSLSISESKEILTFHSSNASSFTENCLQRENILHLLKEYDLGMVTDNSSTLNREESNSNFNVDLKYIENVETIPLDRLEQNGGGQEMGQSQNSFQNIIDITETDFDLKETSVNEIMKKDINTSEERNLKDVNIGNVEDNNNNNDDDDDDDDDDDVICITPENFPSSYQMNSLKSFAEDFGITEQKGYESYMPRTDSNNMSAREITEQSNESNSCRFCGKSFPTQSALKVHQRTHTGLRPYKCPTCGRAFTQKVGLQHHVRTHTGERPYQCKYCIQKFARSDSLGRHIRHKHLKATKDLNSVSNYQKSLVSPLSLESDANQEAARKRDMNRGNSIELESNFVGSQKHSSGTNPNQKDYVMMTPNSFGDLFVLEPSDNVKNNLNECFQEYISYSRSSDDNHIDRKTLGICDKIEERMQNSSYSIPNASLLQSSGNSLGKSSDTIVLEEMAINISDSECNSPEQYTTVKYENDLTCDICCKEFSNSHLLIKHLKDHINASKETATNPDKTISSPVPTCYLIDLSDESLEQKSQSELDIDLMESDLLSNITKEKCMENKNVTEIQEFNSRTDPKIASSSLQNLIDDDDDQTQLGIDKNTDNYQLVTETENTNTTDSVLSNIISPNFLPHHTNVVSTGIRNNITCSKTSNNSLLVIKDGTRFKLGHKRHICKYCSKTFASSSALVIHTRTHTGERPYECDYCSRAFSQVTGLRHHIRTHTGYKPYSCHFCYYRFARSDSLARHLKLEHQKRNKDSSPGKDIDAIQ